MWSIDLSMQLLIAHWVSPPPLQTTLAAGKYCASHSIAIFQFPYSGEEQLNMIAVTKRYLVQATVA